MPGSPIRADDRTTPVHSLSHPRLVRVPLGDRSYDVRIGPSLLESAGPTLRTLLPRARRAFVVHDDQLPADTRRALTTSLAQAGFDLRTAPLSATEPTKSLHAAESLLRAAAAHRLERTEPLIALGGGITGDVAGFAAATYRRGVPFVQCPTTLLSMVDASVGGKTAVNLPLDPDGSGGGLKKNLVGAFHQPILVLADVGTLGSLPTRHLRSGLAECIKHGLLAAPFGDPTLFGWTESHIDTLLSRDPGPLVELIARNVAVKAALVGTDEREEALDRETDAHEAHETTGGRAVLNLGHTFAHAIETIPHLSPDADPANAPLQHGEAVALGLLAACRCALALGLCAGAIAARTEALVRRAGLPTAVRALPPGATVFASMLHDKKVSGGRLRLILPTGDEPGRAAVVSDPPERAVTEAIDSLRAV